MENIERPIYLKRVTSLLGKEMMIILTGQRRVGKSYLLNQLKEWLTRNRPGSNVLYINKELHEYRGIMSSEQLYAKAVETFPERGDNYLLVDEVQDIQDYENALRSLHAEERCQIIVTGSNAYIFSSELGTRLSGRYIEVPVHSLTYGEFLIFHNLEDSDQSLGSYLRVGGLPGLRHYDISDELQVRDYLQSVYSTIMLRDVIAREGIRNVTFMENLAHFVADNIGKLISVRNISNSMKSQGGGVSEILTASYLRLLCGAFILSPVARYDIHGKRLFEQNQKYYFADHGLRNLLCGFSVRGSIEKIMENVIWHHLLVQGFRVTVGILRSGEVDFVATKGDTTIYIQSSYMLASDDTIAREFGSLKSIRDNYPKYVVTMDPMVGDFPEYPGIHHVSLRNFLKMNL